MRVDSRYARLFEPWLTTKPAVKGETRAFCPEHENPKTSKTPSASFNFADEVWHCAACDAGGTFRRLAKRIKSGQINVNAKVVPIDKGHTGSLPSRKQLLLWHRALVENEGVLRVMRDSRGLSVETMERYLIGWNRSRQRYTIPIFDDDGTLVNVRMYKPSAPAKSKMISFAQGTGSARIYGHETLAKHDEVLLCEGELDRLVALQHGFAAVTHTGGAATFKTEWADAFRGKVVYIAYDEDSSGDHGASTATAVLKHTAEAVYRVHLNTDIKGGDITDFFVTLGRSADDLHVLMGDATPLWTGSERHEVPTKGKVVSIEESMSAAHKEPLEMTVMVAGKFDPPYKAPHIIHGTCDQKAGDKCALCPFKINNGDRKVEMHPDDERLLEFVDISSKRRHELLVKFSEARCTTHVNFDINDWYSVEEMSITPSLEHRIEEVQMPVSRVVYNVGTYRTPVNQLARIVGNQTVDHRTARQTFHGWHLEQVNTDLDTFQMTPDLKKRLLRFRPKEGQSPLEKCVEIADDLADNITHIYNRPLLHVGYDLVWHSLASFVFEGKPITKGWVECLVIGDTRTGKSETAISLAKHYRAGVHTTMETASFAGLVGAAVQPPSGKNWFVSWGLLPLNDRRLVILDEMTGMYSGVNGTSQSKNIIEQMSSIRSEGKATIQKAGTAKGEQSARTRLIWISNPRDANMVRDSPDGIVTMLKRLVPAPEDQARYDFVLGVSSADVESRVINRARTNTIRHRYTSEACHDLVMWAWSRKPEQVKFLKGVEEYIYEVAEDIGSRYVPDPPLVQVASVRVKIARLAAAIAARTFSTDKSGECVYVKRVHVKAAREFLDAIYAEQANGYKAHSERVLLERRQAEKAKGDARQYLVDNPPVVEALLAVHGEPFKWRDFEELGGLDEYEAKQVIATLKKWKMIRRYRNQQMMEPALVDLLRELEG